MEPETEDDLLLTDGNSCVVGWYSGRWHSNNNALNDTEYGTPQPTYWQPLPPTEGLE